MYNQINNLLLRQYISQTNQISQHRYTYAYACRYKLFTNPITKKLMFQTIKILIKLMVATDNHTYRHMHTHTHTNTDTNININLDAIGFISDKTMYVSEHFNEPLNCYELPTHIDTLVFIHLYNNKLTLGKNIIEFCSKRTHGTSHMTFVLSKNIKKLIIEHYCTQNIILTKKIQIVHIVCPIEYRFKISKNIVSLICAFDHINDARVETFNPNKYLNKLSFNTCLNVHILLPKHLTRLCLNYYYNTPIILSKYIVNITFPSNYRHKCIFDSLPSNTTLHFHNIKYYDVIDHISNNIKHINLTCKFPLCNIPNSIVSEYSHIGHWYYWIDSYST